MTGRPGYLAALADPRIDWPALRRVRLLPGALGGFRRAELAYTIGCNNHREESGYWRQAVAADLAHLHRQISAAEITRARIRLCETLKSRRYCRLETAKARRMLEAAP